MAPGEPAARFQKVSKNFDGLNDVVRDLDLEVADGAFVALLGPPGAGKSTILAMLAGLEAPTRGTIQLDGVPVNRTPPERRGLGLVIRSHALLPHLTVAENVALPLTARRIPRAQRRDLVASALDQAGLAAMYSRHPAQLSAESRFRVALARALILRPKLVLLDEPLGELEAAEQAEMRLELRQLQRQLGTTMLYATRDPTEALTLATHIAVLHRGSLQQVGPAGTVYDNPINSLVARIVGENNALAGRIEAMDEDIAFIRLRAGPLVTGRIAEAHADTVTAGDRCVLCIRPERIALAAAEAVQMGENALAAVVEEIIHLGDHVRIRLAIGEGTELIVRRPAAAGMAGLAVGRPAALAWEPAHARAYRPDT